MYHHDCELEPMLDALREHHTASRACVTIITVMRIYATHATTTTSNQHAKPAKRIATANHVLFCTGHILHVQHNKNATRKMCHISFLVGILVGVCMK